MSTYTATLRLAVTDEHGAVGDGLEEQLDAVLAELERLDDVTDVDYAASLSRGVVEFTGFVSAGGPADAGQVFSTRVRSAIHAAGGHTPDWPEFTDTGVQVTDVDRDDQGLVSV